MSSPIPVVDDLASCVIVARPIPVAATASGATIIFLATSRNSQNWIAKNLSNLIDNYPYQVGAALIIGPFIPSIYRGTVNILNQSANAISNGAHAVSTGVRKGANAITETYKACRRNPKKTAAAGVIVTCAVAYTCASPETQQSISSTVIAGSSTLISAVKRSSACIGQGAYQVYSVTRDVISSGAEATSLQWEQSRPYRDRAIAITKDTYNATSSTVSSMLRKTLTRLQEGDPPYKQRI